MLAPDASAADPLLAQLTRQVGRWCAERVDARAIDADRTIGPDLRRDVASLGLTGLTLPTTHGGAGLRLDEACPIVAALAEHDRSLATTVGLHLGLGTRGLVAYGAHDLQDELLGSLASGDRIGAFCATEPSAGSDLSRLRTTIRDAGDGSGDLLVRGDKIFVTNGAWAGCYTVLGERLGPDGGPRGRALVVVLPEDAGVEVGREETKLGLRGSSTTPIRFADVRVPRRRLLGEPHAFPDPLGHVLSWGRTLLAAGCVGAASAAWRAARRTTRLREQFGASLDRNEVVREQLVNADALRGAMEATVLDAASDADTLADRSLVAKVLCSEGAWEIADLAVQLHGGTGFVEDSGIPLLLRDTRVPRIFEGANDVLLQQIAVRTLSSPRRTPTPPASGAEAALAEAVDAAVRRARATFPGIRLLREPRVLHRLGRLLVLRESVAAVARLGRRPELDRHWAALAHDRALPHLSPPQPLPPLRDAEES